MRELGRLIAAIVLLVLAGPALAQSAPRTKPTPAATISFEQYEQAKARADKAERDLAIRDAVQASENRQSDKAFARFETLIALMSAAFGVLITGVVIFFSLRTEGAAALAASAAAQNELRQNKARINELEKQAKAATKTAEGAAKSAADALAQTEAAAAAAVENREASEIDAAKTRALYREAASISEKRSSSSGGAMQADLTKEQSETLRAAGEDIAGTPEKRWTVDQFKAAIGKAMYIDSDWSEVLRLSQVMRETFKGDPDAVVYALNRRGDAQRRRLEYKDAHHAYREAIDIIGNAPTDEQQEALLWARHCQAFSLCEQGKFREAAVKLKELIPQSEKLKGATNGWTLSLRHALAHATMELGRAAEAEAEFASLVPLFEQAEGVGSTSADIVRFRWALANLEIGNVARAATILEAIPANIVSSDWSLGAAAALAFTRARVADALDQPAQADVWLGKATEYLANAPNITYLRKRIDAYLKGRTKRSTPDA